MSDTYVECLVKARASGLGKVLKVLLIAMTVFFGLATLIFGLFSFVLAVAAGIGAYFAHLNADLEYEYLYLDKEVTVDKVLARTRRKRVAVYSLDRMEIFAPYRSHHLDSYRNRNVKVKDYSIGEEQQPDLRYAMYYEGGEMALFSPNEAMVKAMKNASPRKVFTE